MMKKQNAKENYLEIQFARQNHGNNQLHTILY